MAHADAPPAVSAAEISNVQDGTRYHPDEPVLVGEANGQDLPDRIILCDNTDHSDDSEQLENGLADSPTERPSRVRFRSRVRITSGLKRHRRQGPSEQDYLSFSPSSSVSGSPSSSISAPLRTRADDDIGKPGWGTLGQRVSIFAQGNSQRRKVREQRDRSLLSKSLQRGLVGANRGADVNERTPLIHSSLPVLYLDQGTDRTPNPSDDEANLSREIDMVFGPWPTRLWNHHWWWWQLEPVICCHCLSDSDDEGI